MTLDTVARRLERPEDPQRAVSAAVITYAEAAGWSRTELAHRIFMSPNQLSHRVTGKSRWTIEDVVVIAGVLGCSIDELVGRR